MEKTASTTLKAGVCPAPISPFSTRLFEFPEHQAVISVKAAVSPGNGKGRRVAGQPTKPGSVCGGDALGVSAAGAGSWLREQGWALPRRHTRSTHSHR